MPVTPIPGANSVVAVGGTPVVAIAANALGTAGGVITNPASEADQNVSPVEPLYINVVDDATLVGNGNTFALAPGQSWVVIAGQTTATSVNALTAGHKFSVFSY